MTIDVPAALERLAQRLGGEGAVLADAGRLSGGASMETWAFAVDGPAGREPLILRRRSAPFDPENARSISLATEAALIRATGPIAWAPTTASIAGRTGAITAAARTVRPA